MADQFEERFKKFGDIPDEETHETEAHIFRGGLPYKPDVNKLKEAFPVPELVEGRILTHAELEGVINYEHRSQRYIGVVNSWIANMRNENAVHLVWVPSIGVQVLDPASLLSHVETRVRQKAKQLVRATNRFMWVDRTRLDDLGKRRLDHEFMIGARLRDAAQQARKELAIDIAPIASLPKPKRKTG